MGDATALPHAIDFVLPEKEALGSSALPALGFGERQMRCPEVEEVG
jgi:hypothetical protein